VDIVPVTAPLLGMVPVIFSPFLYAVLLLRISAATAVASDVSAS
jgi:hypothetical protein